MDRPVTSGGPPRLAVFDVDGTLTDTCDVDYECYVASLAAVFGFPGDPDAYDWAGFDNLSDSSVVRELLVREQRPFEEEDLAAFESDFVDRVAAALRESPERGRPVRGAVDLVTTLTGDPAWSVALATGGFRATALMKLAHAGFDPPEVLATANDSPVRARIVEKAVRDAREAFARDFASIVLVGDGLWDVRTAVELGVPCVGVGEGAAAEALRAAGAVAVVPDFRDPEAARSLLTGWAAAPTKEWPG